MVLFESAGGALALHLPFYRKPVHRQAGRTVTGAPQQRARPSRVRQRLSTTASYSRRSRSPARDRLSSVPNKDSLKERLLDEEEGGRSGAYSVSGSPEGADDTYARASVASKGSFAVSARMPSVSKSSFAEEPDTPGDGHGDGDDHGHAGHHRAASPADLILDLLVVAALAKLGASFELTYDVLGFGQALQDLFALFVPIYFQWWKMVRFLNLFDAEDGVFLAYFISNLIGFSAIVLPLDACSTDWVVRDCPKFTGALAMARFVHCAFSSYAIYHNPDLFRPLMVELVVDFAIACMWAGDSFVAGPPWSHFLALWWLPMVLDVVIVFVYAVFARMKKFEFHHVSLDLHLQSERLELFLILCLGEVVVASTYNMIGQGPDEERIKFADNEEGATFVYPYGTTICLLLLTAAIKVLYFDLRNVVQPSCCGVNDTTHAMVRSPIHGYVWEILHLPLNMAVVLVGAIGKQFILHNEISYLVLSWILAMAVAAISLQHAICKGARVKVKRRLRSRMRALCRVAIVLGCIIMAYAWTPLESGGEHHDGGDEHGGGGHGESGGGSGHRRSLLSETEGEGGHEGGSEAEKAQGEVFLGILVLVVWIPLLVEIWGRQIHPDEIRAARKTSHGHGHEGPHTGRSKSVSAESTKSSSHSVFSGQAEHTGKVVA